MKDTSSTKQRYCPIYSNARFAQTARTGLHGLCTLLSANAVTFNYTHPFQNELEKKRAYEQRIREIQHGSFSPLVFSAAGGMGTIATVVYKRLASLLAEKQGRSYSSTLHWLRCRLNFSLLRSAITCIRGSRSIFSSDSTSPPMESIDLAIHEGQVPAL